MEKITKQMAVNIIMVIISVFIIVLVKSAQSGALMNYKKYLDSDIMMVIITALATTIGWRFAEGITWHWPYNLFIAAVSVLFLVEYGMSINGVDDFWTAVISVSIVVFVLIYIIENFIIFYYFKNLNKVMSIDSLGYNKENGVKL